ncbi:RsmD family RNA methyltransferase [bacterium]|nr:RsmD family RNA methyltransferase [bacterium]MBU1920037.1 RsmD family RNA methyltransferase [bacterium]
MAVRLSSGSHRKRSSYEMRPTASRTLEAVFDILMGETEGRRVLDLYAGVGSYGVLALRRDAALSVFVENSRTAQKRIEKALAQYHLEERAMIFREDVSHFLHSAHRWEEPFDMIFADPPYEAVSPGSLVDAIMESGLLALAGVLVVEHSKKHAPPDVPGLLLRKSRVFGDTTVSIWDRKTADGTS